MPWPVSRTQVATIFLILLVAHVLGFVLGLPLTFFLLRLLDG